MLLEVRGHLVGWCLTQCDVRLAAIRVCCSVIWRLWHLPEVVVGAAHYPRIGKDRGGSWIEAREMKVVLDQYWARGCLIERHLRVRDSLEVVRVGARR